VPKIKYSAKKIQSLKPQDKSIEYFDDSRKRGEGRFGMRVSPAGLKTWFIQYLSPTDKKVKRYSIGTYPNLSLSDARKKANSAMVNIRNGNDPQQEKEDYKVSETFSDLWAEYIRSPNFLKKAENSRVEDKRKFKTDLEDALGSMKLVDIRKKHISAVVDSLAKTSPVSANRLFSLISVLFKFALNKDLIDIHPMYGMDKPAKEKPRSRYLKDDEIKTLWPAFDTLAPNIRDQFKIILLTCQRPGEVYGMRWDELNFEAKLWTIPKDRIKAGKGDHLVPLSEQVISILSARKKNKSPFVFPSNHNAKCGYTFNTSKARRGLWKDTGVSGWGAHDLRRTGRTLLSRIHVKPNIGERVLNHSLGKIEGTYDMYGYLDEKRAALNKLGREIDKIIGVKPTPAKIIEMQFKKVR